MNDSVQIMLMGGLLVHRFRGIYGALGKLARKAWRWDFGTAFASSFDI